MAKKKKTKFKVGDTVVKDHYGDPMFDICTSTGEIHENFEDDSKIIAIFQHNGKAQYVIEEAWGDVEICDEYEFTKMNADEEILAVLLKQAEFMAKEEADKVEKFMVSSLGYSVEMREENVRVGCQTLRIADAIEIADKLKERYS